MKHKYFLIPSILILLTLVLGACSPQTAQGEDQDEYIPTVVQDTRTIVDGNIVPKESLYLKFQSNGEIEKIFVEEGEEVSAGTVLARLSGSESLQAELKSLSAELLDTQHQLDNLTENAELKKSSAYQELLNARAAYNLAEEAYDNFDEDGYQENLDNAKIDVSEAENTVEDAEENLQDYSDLEDDNPTRERYENELEDAQDDERQTKRDQQELELTFEQVKLDLENAAARLDVAESEYDKVKDGPNKQTLELLQAKLDAAKAQQTALQTALDNLDLKAPFDGTVAEIRYSENEFAAAGSPAILFADFSEWYVETSDLTEMDVVNTSVGQTVSIEADAYPGEYVSGSVKSINNFSEVKQGDVTYTARILLEKFDLNLRWGMTVTVFFEE